MQLTARIIRREPMRPNEAGEKWIGGLGHTEGGGIEVEDIRRIVEQAAGGKPVSVQVLSYGATVKTDSVETRKQVARALEAAGFVVQPVYGEGEEFLYHLNVSLPVMH